MLTSPRSALSLIHVKNLSGFNVALEFHLINFALSDIGFINKK